MGWSFRKSFKILPGIRLNLSKSGLGVSGGVLGMRISEGPRGTQLNAGFGPLRYRKQLSPGQPAGGGILHLVWWLIKAGFFLFLLLILLIAAGWCVYRLRH